MSRINYVAPTHTQNIIVNPANTPVIYEFDSDIINVNNIIEPSITIKINSVVTALKRIELQYVILTGVSNPSNTSEFYSPTGNTVNDIRFCAESIVSCINSNPNLNWRYSALINETIPATYIVIKSKYSGESYNLDESSNFFLKDITDSYIAPVFWFINKQISNNKTRGQELQNYNYAGFLEIWKIPAITNISQFTTPYPNPQILSQPTLITTLSQKWNSSNKFYFDISPYLNELTTIEIPFFTNNNILRNNVSLLEYKPNATAAYYVKWGEEFNGGFDPVASLPPLYPTPSEDEDNITNLYLRKYYVGNSGIHYTTKGSFDLNNNGFNWENKWAFPVFNPGINNTGSIANDTDYINYSFLTDQPLYKLVRRTNNYEWVYFYLLTNQLANYQNTTRKELLIYFMDGTNVSYYDNTYYNIATPGMYQANHSYNALNIANYEQSNNKKARAYSVQYQVLTNSWVNYTIKMFYELDLNFELDNNYQCIYWRNKYGVYDQFVFEGLKSETIDTSSINYQQSLQLNRNNNRYKSVNSILRQKTVTKYTINTGWIDSVHYKWIKSLIDSNELYTMFEMDSYTGVVYNGKIDYPTGINIIGYNYTVDDLNNLFNLEITYIVSIPENNISY